MPLQPGQIIKDRYEIDQLLGQGGMGAVYRALDTLPVPPVAVALKERDLSGLPGDGFQNGSTLNSRTRKRTIPAIYTRRYATDQFKTEARLLHNFQHPNLPRVSDYFADGDCLYLAMELIEGQNLDQLLLANDDQPLPEDEVLNWLYQVMDALSYCHSQKIFHRDIKPANIILTPQGKAYLVDFGIARFSNEGRVTNFLGGTPGFRAIEQISLGGVVDARTDIYSLGATLYLLLTGQVPEDALDRVLVDQLDRPRHLNPSISPRVEAAILRCLQLNPDLRFPDIEQTRFYLTHSNDYFVVRRAILQILTQFPLISRHKSETIIEVFPNNSLKDIVHAAPNGSALFLHSGDYWLDSTLKIDKDLSLIAFGDGETTISNSASSSSEALLILLNARWTLSGLRFIHRGNVPVDLVIADGQELSVSGCSFEGGSGKQNDLSGNGIVVKGNTKGLIRDSSFTYNKNGILLTDSARMNLVLNIFERNHVNGIHAINEAMGEIQNNLFSSNRFYGARIDENARFNIQKNRCQKNGTGIAMRGQSSGMVSENDCLQNEIGICVFQDASPELKNNQCNENDEIGISINSTAMFSVMENQCQRNKKAGIFVFGDAIPNLKKNICSKNGSGLIYEGNLGGSAIDNQCSSNNENGIMVMESAQPYLERNHCNKNKVSGIHYTDNASGTATENKCNQNTLNGISLYQSAEPDLTKNNCTGNQRCGIGVYGKGRARISENSCSANKEHGIEIDEYARPSLISNTCKVNFGYGIWISRGGQPYLEKNTFAENSRGDTKWSGRFG